MSCQDFYTSQVPGGVNPEFFQLSFLGTLGFLLLLLEENLQAGQTLMTWSRPMMETSDPELVSLKRDSSRTFV